MTNISFKKLRVIKDKNHYTFKREVFIDYPFFIYKNCCEKVKFNFIKKDRISEYFL